MSSLVQLCVLSLFASATAGQPPGGEPGGFPGAPAGFEMPKLGQVLPRMFQDRLKLTAEQKKQLEALQKQVDDQLASILTKEQQKTMQEPFGGGFGGPAMFKGFNPPGGMGPPKGFGPPNFFGTPAARNDDVKKAIGASDEEWRVIGPKLQKVTAARGVLLGTRGQNALTLAQDELKAVLGDRKPREEEVQEKVAALRAARQAAQTELEAAQKDLRALLTPAQALTMMSLGHLD